MSYFAKLVDRKDVGAICGVHLQFIKFKQQSNKTIFITILFSIRFHFLPLLLIFGLRNDKTKHIPLFELVNANYKQRPSGWRRIVTISFHVRKYNSNSILEIYFTWMLSRVILTFREEMTPWKCHYFSLMKSI